MLQSRQTHNQTFAAAVEATPQSIIQLASTHYCIWLFREIYNNPEASVVIKGKCVDITYDLIHNTKGFTWMSNFLLNFPELLNTELSFYSSKYKPYRFGKKGKY